MKRILAVVLCLILGMIYILEHAGAPHRVRADQPIYGGVLSPLYVTQSDVIWWQTTAIPAISALQLNWAYRIKCIGDGRTISDSGLTATFTSTSGSGFGKTFPCEGWLIYASVEINAPGTVAAGNAYLQILLLNQMPPGGSITSQVNILGSVISYALLGVEANSFYIYSWPGTGLQTPASGPGLNQVLTVGNPASATNFQQALATTIRHRIVNIQYTLVTSATAGNRFACVNFLTGGVSGTIVGRACSPYAQQPSQTVIYDFANATGWATNCSFIGGTQTAVQCPQITVPMAQYWETTAAFESFAINSAVLTELGANGLQVSDQISSISIRETIWQETD